MILLHTENRALEYLYDLCKLKSLYIPQAVVVTVKSAEHHDHLSLSVSNLNVNFEPASW